MTPKHSAGPRRAVPPALNDHVRVVPLWLPKDLVGPAPGIQAPAGPELTYRGGPLIAAAQVFTAFWGQAWNGTDQQNVITTLNEFFRFIVASPYLDQLGEYDAPPYKIGRGRWVGTATVTAPEPEPSVTDTTIREMLQQQLSGKTTFPASVRTRCTSSSFRPACRSSRAATAPARRSAVTTTTSTRKSSTPWSPTRTAPAASAASGRWTR